MSLRQYCVSVWSVVNYIKQSIKLMFRKVGLSTILAVSFIVMFILYKSILILIPMVHFHQCIFVLALYRSPDPTEDATAILPYVYTCPNNDTILHSKDRAFVFCNPQELDYAMHTTEGFKIVEAPDQCEYLAENALRYQPRTTKYNIADLNTNHNHSLTSSKFSVNR